MKKDLSWLTKDTKYMDFIELYTEGTERSFNRFCGKHKVSEKELFYIDDLFELVDRYAKKYGIKIMQDLDYFGDYFYYLEYNNKFYKIGAYAEEDIYGRLKKSDEYYFKRVDDSVKDYAIKYDDIKDNKKNSIVGRNILRIENRKRPISKQLLVDEYSNYLINDKKRIILTRKKFFK